MKQNLIKSFFSTPVPNVILNFILFTSVCASAGPLDAPANMDVEKAAMKQMRMSAWDQNQDIEPSVDSNQYIVGPGDVFSINIKELPSQEFKATVRANGNLFLNEIGEFHVSRLTLREAYKAIRIQIQRAFKGKPHIFVVLRECKKPSVTIIGPMPNSGLLQQSNGTPLPGNARIFDAIKLANFGYPLSPSLFNIRQIVVKNGDATRIVDLLQYMKSGNFQLNPYLYPGDEIHVSHTSRSVLVGGQVQWPYERRVPMKEKETLRSLLDEVITYKSTADTSFCFVRREYGLMEKVPMEKASDFILEDNDWVIIPSKEVEWRNDTVSVNGEVRRPGTFPIKSGKSTAAEVLAWAGGPLETSDMERGFVIRINKIFADPSNGSRSSIVPTGEGDLIGVRPEIIAAQKNLHASNDFAVVHFGGHPENVLLEEGDQIFIPRKENYVYLSGEVKRPGAYLWASGKSGMDYIRMAGGYSSKAASENAYVVTNYDQKVFQHKEISEVRQGDIIVVPPGIEYKKFKVVLLPITQVVIATLSLILSIIAISK